MADCLIEIYTEELPASYVGGIIAFAKKFFRKAFKGKVEVYGTCRRIVALGRDLSAFTPSDVETALLEFVKQVPLPKRMRWDDSGLEFARPIRGLLVLNGEEVLGVRLGKISSANITFYLDPKTLLRKEKEVHSVSEYLEFLDSLGIVLDQERRKQVIVERLNSLCEEKFARPNLDKALLDEVTYLVEAPYLFVGEFEERFLELPPEVLISSMARNQKLFTMSYEDGRMAPYFVGVLEGQGRPDFDFSKVVKRVQSVLSAKLSDALFFWEEDKKVSLHQRARDLDRVILHEKIGSLRNKLEKMKALAGPLAEMVGLSGSEREKLLTAIELSKADLETLMVYEFPELEGIMGYHYARVQGIDEDVALAIRDHRRPVNFEDDLPESKLARLVALLERVSDITAYFKAGLKPTGSEDPFAVRRMVLTLIKLVFNMPEAVDLDSLFRESIKLWECDDRVLVEIEDYFKDRVVAYLRDRGIRSDIASAVWRRWRLNLKKAMDIGKSLNKIAKTQEFQDTVKVLERTYKIVKKVDRSSLPKVDPSLFQTSQEEALWKTYNSIKSEFDSKVDSGDIAGAVKTYSSLASPIHDFFSEVMVNVEDERIRANRMAMMWEINKAFSEKLAEFF